MEHRARRDASGGSGSPGRVRRRSATRLRRAPLWAAVAVGVGLVATAVLAPLAFAARPSPSFVAPPTVAQEEPAEPLSVAFLGDSYAAGTGTDSATKGFARVSARMLGWAPADVFAVGGTGYATPAETNYMSRASGVIAVAPDIVVVNGTRNDMGSAPGTVGAAARSLYTTLKAGLPEAHLLVIGPIWTSDLVPPEILALNEALRQAATESGAVYFDALAPSSWLPGDPGQMSSDGVHPTEAGHQIIARAFADAVRSQQPDLAVYAGD
ncbi:MULTISPECIES: SGNH/GDSL hydrolase family protein [unclassified Blastococcus]